jgi:hypothetical protein
MNIRIPMKVMQHAAQSHPELSMDELAKLIVETYPGTIKTVMSGGHNNFTALLVIMIAAYIATQSAPLAKPLAKYAGKKSYNLAETVLSGFEGVVKKAAYWKYELNQKRYWNKIINEMNNQMTMEINALSQSLLPKREIRHNSFFQIVKKFPYSKADAHILFKKLTLHEKAAFVYAKLPFISNQKEFLKTFIPKMNQNIELKENHRKVTENTTNKIESLLKDTKLQLSRFMDKKFTGPNNKRNKRPMSFIIEFLFERYLEIELYKKANIHKTTSSVQNKNALLNLNLIKLNNNNANKHNSLRVYKNIVKKMHIPQYKMNGQKVAATNVQNITNVLSNEELFLFLKTQGVSESNLGNSRQKLNNMYLTMFMQQKIRQYN